VLAPERLEMRKVVENICANLKHRLDEKGAEVIIQPLPDPRYTFNGCEIAIVGCGVTPPVQVPPVISPPPVVRPVQTANQNLLTRFPPQLLTETAIFVPIDALLAPVTPALILDPEDNDNILQLPLVSRKDY